MTIAGIINQALSVGGGYHQGLNALLQMQALCRGKYGFKVYTTLPANKPVLEKLGLPTRVLKATLWDSVFAQLLNIRVFPYVQARLRGISSFERSLLRDSVDLVYFVNPWHRAMLLQKLNYIFTVLDLCHRDFPEFPEVRIFGEFEVRENMYRAVLPKAYLTLVDSPQLKERIQHRYGLDPDRVLAMPFQPSSLFQSNGNGCNGTVNSYQLGADYLFYPAQFWSHKGHRRLLQALVHLRKTTGDCPVCVFVGDGAHLRARLEQECVSLGLADRVRFLGFVPSDHLEPLYRNARALVMPTYFGPTNLPPLEAWTLGIPVIYPNHLRGHAGDGAIYFEADSAESLAQAISKLDQRGCHQSKGDGRARLQELAEIRKTAETELGQALEAFAARQALWA